MRKKLHINNAQYSVLEASEDFMVTALILVSGAVTDRIGGAGESSPPPPTLQYSVPTNQLQAPCFGVMQFTASALFSLPPPRPFVPTNS